MMKPKMRVKLLAVVVAPRVWAAIVTSGLAMFLSVGQADAGSLVSYWAGDGNANDSVGPNSGTLVGNVTFAPGIVGQAFHFDGTSYFQAPTVGLPTGNQDRTVSLWFNLDSYLSHTEEAWIAGCGGYGTFGVAYDLFVQHLRFPEDRVGWSQWGTGIAAGPVIQPGTWHNAVATNSGDFATLYVDGTAVGSGSFYINTSPNSTFYMGYFPPDQGNGRAMSGRVDEVRVYNYALSASEVRALYASVVPEPGSLILLGIGITGLLTYGGLRRNCTIRNLT